MPWARRTKPLRTSSHRSSAARVSAEVSTHCLSTVPPPWGRRSSYTAALSSPRSVVRSSTSAATPNRTTPAAGRLGNPEDVHLAEVEERRYLVL
ncbi:hypothetical protein [Streptomyces albidochromogenes]|uniref:hypothetical protein n=1 Tax=Streptomyces albidochromogenes TaxID=329524 RepID=UPI001ABF60E0|nr:hypothetical protein [Streptomyces albidochromogenes]